MCFLKCFINTLKRSLLLGLSRDACNGTTIGHWSHGRVPCELLDISLAPEDATH